MRAIAKILVSIDSVGRVLRLIAHDPVGFRVLNSLSGTRSVYGSFGEAESACRKLRLPAHEDAGLIKGNFWLSYRIRPSDYPVLFWMDRIARTENLRVFDFGGGIGQTYFLYSTYLPDAVIDQWTVLDLPEVIEGRNVVDKPKPSNLKFTTSIRNCEGCNIFLAEGAFHYWWQPIAELEDALGRMPEHILINRSPISKNGKSFATIQGGHNWAVPCCVRCRDEFVNEFDQLGYEVVDEWRVMEKTLEMPFLPEFTAPYLGFYLNRGNLKLRQTCN